MSQPAAVDQPSPSTSAAAGYQILKPYNARAQARDCCNFLLFILLLAFLVAAVPAATRLLIFLQPSLPAFSVESSAVSILNVSSSLITARWDLTLSVTNPNSRALSYDRLVAYAVVGGDGGHRLANSTVSAAPFHQAGGATRRDLKAFFPSLGFVVSDCTDGAAVVRPCAPVALRLELEAAAWYDGWTWPEKRSGIFAVCDVSKVEFRPNSTAAEAGRPAGCRSNGRWRRLEERCRTIFWKYVYVAAMCLVILAFSL